MGHLVGHHVVEDEGGRHDQAPREGEIAAGRAAPPIGLRVAHRDAAGAGAGRLRLARDARRDRATRLGTQPPLDTRREFLGRAGDAQDSACTRGPAARSGVRPQQDGHPHHRERCAFDEPHRRRQRREARTDPSRLLLGEAAARAQARPPGQHQFDRAASFEQPQRDAPGAGAATHREPRRRAVRQGDRDLGRRRAGARPRRGGPAPHRGPPGSRQFAGRHAGRRFPPPHRPAKRPAARR